MSVKLLPEHNLGFLSLKVGCKGSSESTLVKMPLSLKSHVAAHFKFERRIQQYIEGYVSGNSMKLRQVKSNNPCVLDWIHSNSLSAQR